MYGPNCDLNFINVFYVDDMDGIFAGANSVFNGDISGWDVSNVCIMDGMFQNSVFDGDISKWDVSNVSSMAFMFQDSKFNGDISNWKVSNVKNMEDMFKDSVLEKAGKIPAWYKEPLRQIS